MGQRLNSRRAGGGGRCTKAGGGSTGFSLTASEGLTRPHLISDFRLQGCWRIHCWCFKAPSVWSLVTAATGNPHTPLRDPRSGPPPLLNSSLEWGHPGTTVLSFSQSQILTRSPWAPSLA